jgi:DNA-binding GntR family transcriptional regulator
MDREDNGGTADTRRGVQPVAARKMSTVDLVLHEIRQSILTGALPPGRAFTVPALTEQLGVSHVPVREALRQLEAQGLVMLSPSRSAIVTPLDPDDLRSVYRLRMRLEPELAAQAAGGRSDEDLAGLARLVRATFSPPAGEQHFDTHRQFHEMLIRPAASDWDLRVLRPLWYASERYTRLVFDPVDVPERIAAAREHAHERLLAAAGTRDPDRLHDELMHHLEANVAEVLEALRSVVGLSAGEHGADGNGVVQRRHAQRAVGQAEVRPVNRDPGV